MKMAPQTATKSNYHMSQVGEVVYRNLCPDMTRVRPSRRQTRARAGSRLMVLTRPRISSGVERLVCRKDTQEQNSSITLTNYHSPRCPKVVFKLEMHLYVTMIFVPFVTVWCCKYHKLFLTLFRVIMDVAVVSLSGYRWHRHCYNFHCYLYLIIITFCCCFASHQRNG